MSYDVTVTREGKWWMVRVPALDGLTQARRLSEVELMAREYIAVVEDVPLDGVEVNVTIDMADIGDAVAKIRAEHDEARRLENDATRRAERLARDLSGRGVPVRDIGTLLGVSYQRAQQLATA